MASTSVYRRQLLARLGIPFDVAAPGVDETPQAGEAAGELVARLARQKARAIAVQHPEAWVIGSDQVAVLATTTCVPEILGKPGTVAGSIAQLERCSGKTLAFVTAVALIRQQDDASVEFSDITEVVFRVLDRATIERYVAAEAPLDCAGSFKSEGLGISLCEAIDSVDPTALIGLPLIRLGSALRSVGFVLP